MQCLIFIQLICVLAKCLKNGCLVLLVIVSIPKTNPQLTNNRGGNGLINLVLSELCWAHNNSPQPWGVDAQRYAFSVAVLIFAIDWVFYTKRLPRFFISGRSCSYCVHILLKTKRQAHKIYHQMRLWATLLLQQHCEKPWSLVLCPWCWKIWSERGVLGLMQH